MCAGAACDFGSNLALVCLYHATLRRGVSLKTAGTILLHHWLRRIFKARNYIILRIFTKQNYVGSRQVVLSLWWGVAASGAVEVPDVLVRA